MEPPSSHVISILDRSGTELSTEFVLEGILAVTKKHGFYPREVSVLLENDEAIRALNLTYRGIDSSTDVLSFPTENYPVADGEFAPLGDIAISVPYANRQASERGIPADQELGFLAIHGALHLIGWDDESDEERDAMVEEMNVIALEIGMTPSPAWSSLHPAEVAK